MSVTTSAKNDVSLEVRKYARNETNLPPPGDNRARTSSLHHMQRVLLVAPPVVVALVLFIGWYMSTTYAHINGLILPAPGDVLTSLISGLIAAAVQPYLAAGQAIPAIVIAPLLVLWLGNGLITITILCMLIVLFPMVITIVLGVQTIDKTLTDAARVEGASGWSLLASIEFPLALPAILAAVRTGLTLSITGALVGEFVSAGDQGLGALVQISTAQFNTPLLFATLVVLGLLAALYYGTTWLLVKLAAAIY